MARKIQQHLKTKLPLTQFENFASFHAVHFSPEDKRTGNECGKIEKYDARTHT